VQLPTLDSPTFKQGIFTGNRPNSVFLTSITSLHDNTNIFILFYLIALIGLKRKIKQNRLTFMGLSSFSKTSASKLMLIDLPGVIRFGSIKRFLILIVSVESDPW
jgi:hypothetical protein